MKRVLSALGLALLAGLVLGSLLWVAKARQREQREVEQRDAERRLAEEAEAAEKAAAKAWEAAHEDEENERKLAANMRETIRYLKENREALLSSYERFPPEPGEVKGFHNNGHGYQVSWGASTTDPGGKFWMVARPFLPVHDGALHFFSNHLGVVYSSKAPIEVSDLRDCTPPAGLTPVREEGQSY